MENVDLRRENRQAVCPTRVSCAFLVIALLIVNVCLQLCASMLRLLNKFCYMMTSVFLLAKCMNANLEPAYLAPPSAPFSVLTLGC